MTLAFTAFVLVMSLYMVRRLVWANRITGRWRWIVAAVTVALAGWAGFSGGVARVADPAALRWFAFPGLVLLGFLMYLLLGLLVTGLVSLVLRFVDRREPTPEAGLPRRVVWTRRLTVVSLIVAVVVTGYGRWMSAHPTVNDYTYTSGQLPAEFDGFKVAFLSDVHLGPAIDGPFLRKVVADVNAAKPDLVILGGDFADGSVTSLAGDIEPLRDLRATYGVVGVSGNHEFYSGAPEWLAYWRSLGVNVLDNDVVVITRGTASIDIIGVNDRNGQPPHVEDLRAALGKLEGKYGINVADTGRFRLLAAHQPRQALTGDNLAGRSGVDLQLSGHTHGGQMWPLMYLVPLQQPVVQGWKNLGGVDVLTGRGVAGWGPPLRVGSDPEVLLVTLKRG
ncbi:MAG TPA: metallophosphoesterase [Propionibacteriaceae bacterium]|nr:metallophosphoesterase [Propionibacteriaceae bacterium]